MLIKNVKANWSFLRAPDEAGKYRTTFIVDDSTYKEVMEAIKSIAEKNGETLESIEWKGSFKQDENGIKSFSAKANAEFHNKRGEIQKFELPVYNTKAQRFKTEEIPMIKNGATINLVVEPYFITYKKKKGVMLGLRSVQLISYEEYIGQDSNPYADETEDCQFKADGSSITAHNSEDEEIFQ